MTDKIPNYPRSLIGGSATSDVLIEASTLGWEPGYVANMIRVTEAEGKDTLYYLMKTRKDDDTEVLGWEYKTAKHTGSLTVQND